MTKAELQAALDLCVGALEAVEWVKDTWSYDKCAWCGIVYHTFAKRKPRHADDCLRQRALAAALMQ